MTVRSASIPPADYACPLCDVFPFSTAADLGEHVAAHAPVAPSAPTSAPAPVPTGSGRFETVENGFGGSTTRRIQPTGGDRPTEKQVAYYSNLVAERFVDTEGLRSIMVEAFSKLSRREASAAIDSIKLVDRLPRTTSTSASSSTPMQDLSAGLYRVGETIYKVQAAKGSGNLYAKRLSGNADDGFVYEYEAGAIRSVRSEGVRLTVEEAKAFGRRTGTCCVCAAVLTNPESIALGIGPICGGRI